MSAPAPAAQPQAALSTVETLKHGTYDAIQWFGKSVKLVSIKGKEYLMKLVEMVKPFFQHLQKTGVDLLEKLKASYYANPEMYTYIGVTAVIAVAGTIAATTMWTAE